MSTKPQDKQYVELERQQLNALIGKQVMHVLGRPADLFQVQVRALFGDHYRVNVLIGQDAASVKIAHSYFLVIDGEGNITTSTPQIQKQY